MNRYEIACSWNLKASKAVDLCVKISKQFWMHTSFNVTNDCKWNRCMWMMKRMSEYLLSQNRAPSDSNVNKKWKINPPDEITYENWNELTTKHHTMQNYRYTQYIPSWKCSICQWHSKYCIYVDFFRYLCDVLRLLCWAHELWQHFRFAFFKSNFVVWICHVNDM